MLEVESNDPNDEKGPYPKIASGFKYEIASRPIASVKPDEWHTIKVSLRGDRCTITVNGTDPQRYSPVRHQAGQVGFRTWAGVAEFKDIKITNPDGQVLWDGLPDIPK